MADDDESLVPSAQPSAAPDDDRIPTAISSSWMALALIGSTFALVSCWLACSWVRGTRQDRLLLQAKDRLLLQEEALSRSGKVAPFPFAAVRPPPDESD
jgi:hypothetical protein